MGYDRVFRAKGLVDGCSTLVEMAVALERAAADLRQMNAQGISLEGRVEDDYALLISGNAEAAERHGLHESDSPHAVDTALPAAPHRFVLVQGGGGSPAKEPTVAPPNEPARPED